MLSTSFDHVGNEHSRGPGSRRRRVIAVVAAMTLLATLSTACDRFGGPDTYATSVPAPPGAGTLRYRDPSFSVTTTSNVVWSTTAKDLKGNPVSLKLDVYQPTDDTVAQRPALVVAHSGGFYTHTKTDGVSVDFAKYFASLGYVVISIDYRLLAKVNCGSLQGLISDASGCKVAAMAATSDGQAAVRWLRANSATYRVDPNRIAMSGDSAGALMSNLAGILADVPGSPEEQSSIDAMAGAPLNTDNLDQSSQIQAWVAISGGLPSNENVGLAEKLALAPTLPAPGYFFSGTKDNQVPFAWAEGTRDELVKLHRIVIFGALQDAGHVPYAQYGTLFKTQSANFFYAIMNLGNADQ